MYLWLVKSLIRFVVYSNIFVAFCVLSLAISSELLLGISNFKISQFVFFATVVTYNFQRIIRIKKISKNARKEWLENNKIIIISLSILGLLMSIYCFVEFQTNTQIVIAILAVASLLYPFGLRTIPHLKIIVIAAVWTFSTMFLLVVESNQPIDQNIALHLITRFLFIFAIIIPFDIRDLKYDKLSLKTIPIVFGESKARLIALGALFIAEIIAIIQHLNFGLSFKHLLSFSLLMLLSSIMIIKSNQKQGDMYFSFWVESMSIACYLFLAISYLMF